MYLVCDSSKRHQPHTHTYIYPWHHKKSQLLVSSPAPDHSQGRMRPSSVDLDGSVPDLSLRLLATVMVEGPDYASAPNFATAFVGTLLDGWSADQLTELANSYLFLRRSIKVLCDQMFVGGGSACAGFALLPGAMRSGCQDFVD
jgi:hypothetical protein